MPECSFHPGVETNMRCAECDRPICPKDMVLTPVGEAVRRGSGGHRGTVLAAVSAACVIVGSLAGGLSLLTMVLGVLGAVSTLSWTWSR